MEQEQKIKNCFVVDLHAIAYVVSAVPSFCQYIRILNIGNEDDSNDASCVHVTPCARQVQLHKIRIETEVPNSLFDSVSSCVPM